MFNFVQVYENKSRLIAGILADTGFEPYSISINERFIALQGDFSSGIASKIAAMYADLVVDESGYASCRKPFKVNDPGTDIDFEIYVEFTLT